MISYYLYPGLLNVRSLMFPKGPCVKILVLESEWWGQLGGHWDVLLKGIMEPHPLPLPLFAPWSMR
jgi:hypothetical protein